MQAQAEEKEKEEERGDNPLVRLHDFWFPQPFEAGVAKSYPWEFQTGPQLGEKEAWILEERATSRHRVFRICLIVGLVVVLVLTVLLAVFVAAPFVSLSREYKDQLEQSHKRIQKLRDQLKSQQPALSDEQKSEIIQQNFAAVAEAKQPTGQVQLPSTPTPTLNQTLTPTPTTRAEFMRLQCPDKAHFLKEWWTSRFKSLFSSTFASTAVQIAPTPAAQPPPATPAHPQTQSAPAPDALKHLPSRNLLGILCFHAPRPDSVDLNEALAQRVFKDYVALVAHLQNISKSGEERQLKEARIALRQLSDPDQGRKVIEDYLGRKKCGWFRKLKILSWLSSQKQKFM